MVKLESLKKEAKNEIKKAKDLRELDRIFGKYLGKKGKITILLKNLKSLPKEKRKRRGKELNLAKEFIEKEIEEKAKEIKEKLTAEILKKEKIDITAPGKKISPGHLHPLTQVQRKVEEIFQSMGFSIVEGPEIETEWYNFDALNIPKEHPARDMWNTLWLKVEADQRGFQRGLTRKKLLLRTHTSPVQVRYMEKNQPPLRIIVPGRVFRHEATDASHEVNFYHIEGLMVDKAYSRQSRDGSSESLIQNRDVSVANFKAIIQKFYQKFFERQIEIRLIPCYFPFTEPSFEVDITCLACGGKGCPACQKTGWMEMMGAGMVHPNVFKNSGLNPKEWQGFAFGMGLDRLAMMKYKINDIRLFYGGDLRFLNQF